MLFTTRFWGSTAALLWALLLQSCQSNSLSATEEEELAASGSSVPSIMHQRALSESLVGTSVPGASSSAHVLPSCLMALPSDREELLTLPSARCLNLSESSPLVSVSNPPEGVKPPAKRRCVNVAPEQSNKETRDGEEAEPDDAMALLQSLPVSWRAAAQEAAKDVRLGALEALVNVSKASPGMFPECPPPPRVLEK